MSLYGYTTRTDLARVGSFLLMGLFGVIIASLVNIFLASSALQLAISVIGVVVFVGLTAYDTQRIKSIYLDSDDPVVADKKIIMGALTLYLESVRRDHAGLHSFLSMSRIEARRRNASALRLRFSQSLARRLHRPSHANVRSTTHRFGRTTNPFA